MSARIYISGSTVAIPQADFQAQREGDNGAWTATQSFQIVKGALDSPVVRSFFGINRPITQLDPNAAAIWSFLRVRKITPQVIAGGWEMVTVEFGGVPSTDGDGNPIADAAEFQVTYSMRGQTGDLPLSDHPKFKELALNERNSLGSLMGGEYGWGPDPFEEGGAYRLYYRNPLLSDDGTVTVVNAPDSLQLSSADAISFANLIASGVTTYRAGGFTWSKRWASTSPLTSAQLNALGKITTPPGSPPTPSGGRDWLLTYAAFEQSGEVNANPSYTNEITFELSEEGGWDSFLQG